MRLFTIAATCCCLIISAESAVLPSLYGAPTDDTRTVFLIPQHEVTEQNSFANDHSQSISQHLSLPNHGNSQEFFLQQQNGQNSQNVAFQTVESQAHSTADTQQQTFLNNHETSHTLSTPGTSSYSSVPQQTINEIGSSISSDNSQTVILVPQQDVGEKNSFSNNQQNGHQSQNIAFQTGESQSHFGTGSQQQAFLNNHQTSNTQDFRVQTNANGQVLFSNDKFEDSATHDSGSSHSSQKNHFHSQTTSTSSQIVSSGPSTTSSNALSTSKNDQKFVTNVDIQEQGITHLNQIRDEEIISVAAGSVKCDTVPVVDTVTITNIMEMPSTTYIVKTLSQTVTRQKLFTNTLHETQTVTYATKVFATNPVIVATEDTTTVTKQLPDETVVNTITQVVLRTNTVLATDTLLHTRVQTKTHYETSTVHTTTVVDRPHTLTAHSMVTSTPLPTQLTHLNTQTVSVTVLSPPFIRILTETSTVVRSAVISRTVAADTATQFQTKYFTHTNYMTVPSYKTVQSTVFYTDAVTLYETSYATVTETSTQLHTHAKYVPRDTTITVTSTAWEKSTKTYSLTHTAIVPETTVVPYYTSHHYNVEITDRPVQVQTITSSMYKSTMAPVIEYVTMTMPCITNSDNMQGYVIDSSKSMYQ